MFVLTGIQPACSVWCVLKGITSQNFQLLCARHVLWAHGQLLEPVGPRTCRIVRVARRDIRVQTACQVSRHARRVLPGSTSRLSGLRAVRHVRVTRLQCREQRQSVVACVCRDTRDRTAVRVLLVLRELTKTCLGVVHVPRVELMGLVRWAARLSRIASLRVLLGRRDLTGHVRLASPASTRRLAGVSIVQIAAWVLIPRRWGPARRGYA